MKRLITILFLFLSAFGFSQIVLTNTTHTLELTTTTTAGIDYEVTYSDETTSGTGIFSVSRGKITTATTTTILSAPASSTTRVVMRISAKNISTTTSNTVYIGVDVSGTNNENSVTYTLKAGEQVEYNDRTGWTKYTTQVSSTITGISKQLTKTGTAKDVAGAFYGYWKDTGVPGAWAPGTPGLAGRATDGNSAADAGCIAFPDAGGGLARYLTGFDVATSSAHAYSIWDVLWVNSGLVVTTTTGQTINSVTLPARDDNGSTNGQGCLIGLYATAALGNAAAVSNSTITYTNSDGVGSRTATLTAITGSQIPATPVIGTVVWFNLAAGDKGVQSIQTVTLNTTLTSGSASIFIARRLASVPGTVANVLFQNRINYPTGVRMYDDACILLFCTAFSTTADNVSADIITIER
jgi:hypothetical protein